MKMLVALSLLFATVAAAQPADGGCRCGSGNGACQLTPLVDPKDETLEMVVSSRTDEKAYSVKESAVVKKKKLSFTIVQGGCDHPFYTYEFTEKAPKRPLSDRATYLKRLAELLEITHTTEGKDIAQAIRKAIPKIETFDQASKKGVMTLEETPYSCGLDRDKLTCMFVMQLKFSHLSIAIKLVTNGEARFEVTETQAL